MTIRSSQLQAFSLVELSIVLVILGLLTGGILAGQSLIRASELRAVTTEYQRYSTAIQSFRDRYMAIPGDMPNAIKFWGAADADPATCRTISSTTQATCDGDGNGQLTGGSPGYYEWFRFWQHLANAGLIEGSYTGIAGGGSTADALIGTNVPASKLSNAGWTSLWLGVYGATSWFSGDYGNILIAGSDHPTSYTYTASMQPEEVWNIDIKLDDGKPAQGKISVFPYSNCTPAGTNTDTAVDYSLTTTTISCAPVFRKVY